MSISNISYYFWLLKRKLSEFNRSGYSPDFRRWSIALVIAILVIFPLYVVYLDSDVRSQFEAKRWELPARVYARPL